MKLALVIGNLERGGSERQIVEFVRVTHSEHAECVVICLGDEGPLASEVHAANAKVISLKLEGSRSLRGVGKFAHGLWRFARVLKAERPDAIYAFLFWGYSIALPLAALVVPRACRIQARRSLPDVDVPSRSIFRGLRWIADRCSHGVIVNSLAVGSAVARHEPVLSGRLWVVPNGVRSMAHRARPAGARLTIVCVANLKAYKGHATLLGAVRRLRPRGWSLLLVGEGPERESIERLIASANLQERVFMLGRRSDVHDILDAADLVVLPSYSEGMPNAVLEAMAHGIPVVASDVGGVRSLLGSGAGIIVAPGDDQALADALRRLIDDPSLRAEMGDKGRGLAQGSLSVEAMRDATLSAISDIRERQSRVRSSSRTRLRRKWWT
jgi:glycosyltransferase involved in cell wall biosynthesis